MHKLFLVVSICLITVGATVMVCYQHWHDEAYALSPDTKDFERLLGLYDPSDERMLSIPDPPEDSPERQKAIEIAKKVQDAYGKAEFLSFEAETYRLPGSLKVTASVAMGNERLRSRISFDGKPLYELRWEDGQYHERKLPFREIPEQSISYPMSDPYDMDGRGDLRLIENVPFAYRCLSAHVWHSWVGEENEYANDLCQSIARGRYLGVTDVDGHRCFVIFKPAAWPTKYYVRCEDFFLAKKVNYRQIYLTWRDHSILRRPFLSISMFRNFRTSAASLHQ